MIFKVLVRVWFLRKTKNEKLQFRFGLLKIINFGFDLCPFFYGSNTYIVKTRHKKMYNHKTPLEAEETNFLSRS